MAVTSMMQRLLDNALTAKFAKSLDQNDLPEGWADNPEIVQLAEDAYSVMGTESPWFKSWFQKSKVVDENKDPKHIYHGTARGDRVGSEFRKDRATSGPMAFFTDNYDIAANYARDKADTSISREGWGDDWYKQFVLNQNGREVPVVNAFWSLPKAKRDEITQKAAQIGRDDDYNITLIPGNDIGSGGYKWNFKESRGNPVRALYKEWLESGNLFGEDEKYFQDVLKLAGLDNVIYKDPNARFEKVYDTFLSSQKPFDTSKINKTTLEKLRSRARREERYYDPDRNYSADFWDKTSRSPAEWIEHLDDDLAKGTTHVWTSIPDWVTDVLKKQGYDSIKDLCGKFNAVGHTVHIPFEPTQIKAASNRGTFNLKDPNIYKGLIPAVGAGGLLALMSPEEAEAAVRPDIEDVISKAIKGQEWAGRKAGNLESPVAQEALAGSAKYKGGDGYFTEHGLTWRNKNNGWTPAQIAEGYRGIYDSQDTVVVPNVLGVNPSASEALWNPNGIDGHSWYMPIAPYKKGFKGVTIYDPEASQVERLLKDKGYWEGGSTSSIFTPTLGERSKSIGSGTLPAVNSPAFETTIRGLDAWSKQNLPKVAGAATGAALPFLSPAEVEAERARYAQIEKEQGLQSPIVDPVDILTAPFGVAGLIPKAAAMAAEIPISYGMDKAINGLFDLFSDEEE